MAARSVADFKALARRRLPPFLFEYVESGSYQEVTLARNEADLAAISLRQRVLRDVSAVNLTTNVFGTSLPLPLALAPVGMAGMLARRGEVQARRAANRFGLPFTLSSAACCGVEEVGAAADGPYWFQLYMLKDRDYMAALLTRAQSAGCSALLVTVDVPILGVRYRDYRAGISNDPWIIRHLRLLGQIAPHPGWMIDVGMRGRPHHLGNMMAAVGSDKLLIDAMLYMQANLENRVSWDVLDWLRQHWRGPIVIKGVLDAEDARAAASAGADGIIASNHGGRQLDGVPSTANALPRIRDAVGDALTIIADGGVRTGLDIARMLALGADLAMIGRPWAYALAAGGEAGVAQLLRLLEAELRVAMMLTGATTIAALGRDSLVVG